MSNTSDADVCSELFVEFCSRILFSNTPTMLAEQHAIDVFLHPSARHKPRSINRQYSTVCDPFCLVLIESMLKCASKTHHLKALARECLALDDS